MTCKPKVRSGNVNWPIQTDHADHSCIQTQVATFVVVPKFTLPLFTFSSVLQVGWKSASCSTFQVGCLREIGSNGEIGIRSIDAKITQTTNPIVKYDQDNRIMVNVILKYLPIALFLSNNHPEMYCK